MNEDETLGIHLKRLLTSDFMINGLIKEGAINIMNVAHDDDCVLLKNKSKECTCNPDISIDELKEKE